MCFEVPVHKLVCGGRTVVYLSLYGGRVFSDLKDQQSSIWRPDVARSIAESMYTCVLCTCGLSNRELLFMLHLALAHKEGNGHLHPSRRLAPFLHTRKAALTWCASYDMQWWISEFLYKRNIFNVSRCPSPRHNFAAIQLAFCVVCWGIRAEEERTTPSCSGGVLCTQNTRHPNVLIRGTRGSCTRTPSQPALGICTQYIQQWSWLHILPLLPSSFVLCTSLLYYSSVCVCFQTCGVLYRPRE